MRNLVLVGVFVILSSCSFNKMAVKSGASILDEASITMETEKSWAIVRDALPTNIKMMEGMLTIDPTNQVILKNLTKAYSAYAFGVSETLYLHDQWGETEKTDELDAAIDYYGRAMKYGLRYLEIKGIKTNDLLASQDLGEMKKLVSKVSGDAQGREVLFFLAQSWGSAINLQRGNITLLSSVGVVKNLIDTVCEIEPNFQFGACDMFNGAFEVARPRTLGGNPEKGANIFKQAMIARPDSLLIPIAYLQYYVIPTGNEVEYKRVKEILLTAERQFKNSKVVVPGSPLEDVLIQSDERLSILNSIALKRFEIMKKYEKKFF